MDVHTTNYTLCALESKFGEEDAVLANITVGPDHRNILNFVHRIKEKMDSKGNDKIDIECGYEAGCLGYSLHQVLTACKLKCTILAPTTMHSEKGPRIKTDRRDAKLIAQCLANGGYHAAHIPNAEDNADKEYVRMRDDHKIALKTLKQQTKALCIRFGFICDGTKWTGMHLKWLRALKLPEMICETLNEYLTTYDELTAKIARFDQRIQEIANLPTGRHPLCDRRQPPRFPPHMYAAVAISRFPLPLYPPRLEEVRKLTGEVPLLLKVFLSSPALKHHESMHFFTLDSLIGRKTMDKNWSEMNRDMQALLAKKGTFPDGIRRLLELRESLFGQITGIVNTFPCEAFFQMPFAGADGYHSKTLAYSVWHIFRIEDIVAHEMIAGDRQILFEGGYMETVRSPIVTTGNELNGKEIAAFSAQLDIKELYRYARDVMISTNRILTGLEYADLKRKFGEETQAKLRETGCISEDEKAVWLIGYWCSKDVLGLIRMPFSRHWIMHVEAMRRIKNRLCNMARKGVDPIAYCGFSCDHCFLGEWCGSCRTAYNTCSFATVSPDRKCPNAACCQAKGIDGCYACESLETCEKGFYIPTNDGANAAKAQAMYVRKHGKKEFLKVQDRLHEKYDFKKTQEILGQDYREGLRILEEN